MEAHCMGFCLSLIFYHSSKQTIHLLSTMFNILTVHHKCSSNNPCHNDGLCESVENIYQCNCSDTDHYGSLCETGTITSKSKLFNS